MARYSLSALQTFIEPCRNLPFWIGIDAHKRSNHLAILRSDGQNYTFVSTAEPSKLVEQIVALDFTVGGVAYEAGPTGFSLARAFERVGFNVLVAAPSRLPRSVSMGAKTDRLDCLKLATYAAKGLIRPIALPTAEEEARRSLMRRRHQVVSEIRSTKQRIKALVLYLGLEEPPALRTWRATLTEELQKLVMEPESRLTLESLLRELGFHKEELSRLEQQIEQLCCKPEHRSAIRAIKSVPGVGNVVAATFYLELYRPERFNRGDEVSSYLGLAPMVRHSGAKTPRGQLRPAGQHQLRSLLIEAAWIWRTKDPYASNLYNKLVNKSGIAQKAITALARRLAIILWRLSIEKRAYHPAS